MPDREFIHSSRDVSALLFYAMDCGFRIIDEEPVPEPAPRTLSIEEAAEMVKGQFFLFRPEWVYGPFHISEIPDGCDRGKYHVQRVNFAPIAVYFQGERLDQGVRRFGSCSVSSYRDWLEMPAKVVNEAPADTDLWFKQIVAHMSSGVFVKAGVHKYNICKGVIADPAATECLPPFDFIPWGPEVLQAERKRGQERETGAGKAGKRAGKRDRAGKRNRSNS